MNGSQGVILLMMGALILYLVWHPASPFNDTTVAANTTPTIGSGGGSSDIRP